MNKGNMVDYRGFRFSKLNDPEYRHLKLLLFWPLYGLAFLTVERLWVRPYYYPMHCGVDDLIPLCEYFLIPYLFWFVFLIGIHLYTLLYDVPEFVRLEKFIIVSYSIAVAAYVFFPNCQELRPVEFARDNVFTRFLTHFYQFDTNTNVCPSIHVIGSVAVAIAGCRCKRFSSLGWRITYWVIAILISVSTVFLKQHSVLDVLAAVPVCLIAYYIAYAPEKQGANTRQTSKMVLDHEMYHT